VREDERGGNDKPDPHSRIEQRNHHTAPAWYIAAFQNRNGSMKGEQAYSRITTGMDGSYCAARHF
jgi:hypothetical protein